MRVATNFLSIYFVNDDKEGYDCQKPHVTIRTHVLSSFIGHNRGCACNHVYEMFYVINKKFEWERSLCSVDVMFERVVHRYWFECVEFTNQDRVTVYHQGCV